MVYLVYLQYKNIFGVSLYCRMETSRIIRVGTRNYIILRSTYCCCIRRICTGMYNTQNNTARKWHNFGIEIDFVEWVVEIHLISVWRIKVDLTSM